MHTLIYTNIIPQFMYILLILHMRMSCTCHHLKDIGNKYFYKLKMH